MRADVRDPAWSLDARVTLGRSGVRASRIGLGSSYGLLARDVEWAADRGVNYFYWGSMRRPAFALGLRALARRREELVIVAQSFARRAPLVRLSLEGALRALGTDYADFLLLGYWNTPPPRAIVDAAEEAVRAGKARAILISCHERPLFPTFIGDPRYGAIMARYNAAHTGAEVEVFPQLGPRAARPGVVAYTATRWGTLLDRRIVPPEEPLPRGSDCYRFALSHPDVDMVLAGPKDRAELVEALAALDRGPMSADEIAWMKRVGSAVRATVRGRVGLLPTTLTDLLTGVSTR